MKRLMLCLMILLLTIPCAVAETLREQTAAPETVQEQWMSQAVPMRITIDADVEVPDVTQAYHVDVTPHNFTAEEVARIGSAVFGTPLEGLAFQCVYRGWCEDWRCRAQLDHWCLDGSYSVLRGQRLCDTLHIYRDVDGLSMGNSMGVDRPHPARQNPYTPQEAQSIADELAAVIAPSHQLAAWGTQEIIPDSAAQTGAVDTQTEFPEWPEAYLLCYTPQIGSIPELYTNKDCFIDEENTYFPFYCDRLYIQIAPDGPCDIYWQAPEDFGAQTPCELLPFEQIMNVARELLPLTQVDTARRLGEQAGIMVDRITLSYCRVQKWNTLDEYELVPVWDFFGHEMRLTEDGLYWLEMNRAHFPYDTLLTINATNGLVIDRTYGY